MVRVSVGMVAGIEAGVLLSIRFWISRCFEAIAAFFGC